MSSVNGISIAEEIKVMGGVLFEQVGSSITCSPPVLENDIDYLVYTKNSRDFTITAYEDLDWELAGSMSDQNDFYSLRRDKINLIVTQSLEFYSRFLLATEVAKRLNLLKKEDRITLFQAILYGNPKR